jgi:AraC-like DNA-binding protein
VLGVKVGLLPSAYYRQIRAYPRKSAAKLSSVFYDSQFTNSMHTGHNWQLKFWSLPQLDNLELLHASRVTHDYPRHMHEGYSIAVMLQGSETTACRGTNHTARPGALRWRKAEEVHSNQSAGSEYRLIKVRPKTLERVARDLGGHISAPFFSKVVVNDPILFRRLLNLHLKLEQNISALEQESEFISTMGVLLTRLKNSYGTPQPAAKAGSEDLYVRLVRDYLRSHYAENVSLTQLTSLTNLSSFYLLRVFRNRAGFPPHEYQTQVRIAHARKLIRNGTPISQAALETGFFDQSHLSRNFKRIVGVTPRQYFHGKLHKDN